MAQSLSTPFICASLPRGPHRSGDAGRKVRRG